MTLTSRLMAFYLGSLAAVLAGFSTALYMVAQDHLYRQADERLDAALNVLGAIVEVTPDGVEWESGERNLRLSSGPDQIAWVVTDDTGLIVARSEQPDSDDLLADATGRFRGPADATRRMHWRGERWQAGQRRFVPGGTAKQDDQPPDPNEVKYPALVVTAALPLEPTRALLHKMLAVLVGISVCVLAAALAGGRFVCRRALLPVCRMAEDARAIDPTDPARRLSIPGGGDELSDLGTAFNGLLARLHESAERHRRFAGDASHQLRTPLAALLGQIEVALRRDRNMAEYRNVLSTAQAKATHLTRIVEALLFLTRAGSEAGLPARERFDIAGWLREYIDQWNNHARFSDIRLVGADGPLMVVSHPVLLGEIMTVLIDNACRYSAVDSPVTVSVSQAGKTARIEVADRGPGIAAADLPQVFTPFFRTADALRANKQGVGLGLSIARRLAEAVGRGLTVTSTTGEGCRFAVTVWTAPPG